MKIRISDNRAKANFSNAMWQKANDSKLKRKLNCTTLIIKELKNYGGTLVCYDDIYVETEEQETFFILKWS